jgi:putative addiction module component (TIGR02574 family)
MTKSLLNELLKLSPAERIQLAQDLWDSVEPEEIPPLTTEQMQEAERRYADLLRHPEKASTWEEVKARLLARYSNADPAGSRKEPP